METNVAAALEVHDYQQASRLLKQWYRQEPSSLLLRLYVAKLQEQTNKLDAAQKTYLALLKRSTSTKIIRQARAGLQRIGDAQKLAKAQALEEAKATADGKELAILAITSLPSAASTQSTSSIQPTRLAVTRQAAIDSIAEVFNLDPYTARLKLPNSGFRIHRIGPSGEIDYYAQQLAAPTYRTRISQIKSLQTFQASHFEALLPSLTLVCKNAGGQFGKISFDPSEVSQIVSGQLPIFEQVADLGTWGKSVHKEKVQDYAQVLDLHLPGRQIVLRLCDRLYQYQKGIALSDTIELNSRIQWNTLRSQLIKTINGPHHNGFTKFGKSALEFVPLLPAISPNLDLVRRGPSDWDLAFHLYSSLCYFHQR